MESHVGREETVALLALLRLARRPVSWADVALDVLLTGSAVSVLTQLRANLDADSDTLLPNPAVAEALERAEAELADWETRGLDLVTVLSSRFPDLLGGVFDSPPFLFARGEVLPEDRGISVVGSRRASVEGLKIARAAARMLAERGLTVVSGLAQGIDAAAHMEALAIGARTVAVLGTGIERYYPAANRRLQDQIADRGLVISQFYPDQPPTRTTFPMRNGTMSGYGLATIVVEAGENSGGRIQARKAADHGRPVILTGLVTESTSWGAQLKDRPGTFVVNSDEDLAEVIDQVLDANRQAEQLAKSLVPPEA
jgi:DNA processing protein